MEKPKNAMEIFTLLNKSNCKLCGEKTCLAFAGAVHTGKRKITECPYLDSQIIALFGEAQRVPVARLEDDEYLISLRQKVQESDYKKAAGRIGADATGGLLSINVMGKPFTIDSKGQFRTDLHIISWLVIPVLEYVCNCKGELPKEHWISFREIPGGKEKYGLFKKRGESVLKSLADKFPDFFDDIIHMFDGKSVAQQFESDISVVLHPLPLVPIMICYWKPEDGMESSLNVFFDETVHENLGVESAFFLGTGLIQMIEKMALHHGF